jgi:hypothetical protein
MKIHIAIQDIFIHIFVQTLKCTLYKKDCINKRINSYNIVQIYLKESILFVL